jgi:hypothetical protein
VLAAALLAALLAALGRWHLQQRLDQELAPRLGALLGRPVALGHLEATLFGGCRLLDVQVDRAMHIAAVEAQLGYDGAHRPFVEALHIERPRLVVDAARLPLLPEAERLALPRPAARRRQLPPITVHGGRLELRLPGGRLAIEEIAAGTAGDALRVTARRSQLRWGGQGLDLEADFPALAADVDPVAGAVRRLLAVSGRIRLRGAGQELRLTQVALARGLDRGELALRARVDHPGRAPAVHLRLRPQARGLELGLGARDAPLGPLRPLLPPWIDPGETAVSGQLRAQLAPQEAGWAATVSGELVLDPVRLEHRRLAAQPVSLPLRLGGAVEAGRHPAGGWLTARALTVAIGGVELRASGALRWQPGGALERATLHVALPAQPCRAVLAALPAPLRQQLTGLDAEGTLAASLDAELLATDAGYQLTPAPGAPRPAVFTIDNRCRVRSEPVLADVGTLEGSPAAVPAVALDELPAHVWGAFVAAEDAGFFQHPGFDLRQIERSLAVNLSRGAVVRGGSTITQQLVKNVFLSPERSLARKLQEAVLAWRAEARLSKRRILSLYLGIVELAPGVRGLPAAARHWFALPAASLSPRQAAFLAAITRAPQTFATALRGASAVPAELGRRIDGILHEMRRSGTLGRRQLAAALAEPLVLGGPPDQRPSRNSR